MRALLTRRTSPRGALRFCVETMATDPRAVSRWLSGQSNAAQDAADLGLVAPGQWWGGRDTPPLTSGEQVADPRLPLAHVAAACECGIDRQSWRNPKASDARWCGSWSSAATPCPTSSRGICDAVTEQTVGIALDVDQTDSPDEQS